MEKGKRLKFKCWNCNRNYSLWREITEEQVLAVACPYCNADGVVDLKPYRKETITVLKGKPPEKSLGDELVLPDILPTQPKEQ